MGEWGTELGSNASNISVIAASGINTLNSFNMRDIAAKVAAATSEQTQLITSAFADSLYGESYRNRRSRLTTIHRDVGYMAQDASLRRYMETHTGKASGYRSRASKPWDRDSGGKMISALSDSNVMFRASYDGLEFVNTSLFDKKARQWYRLNFGARGRQGSKYKMNGESGTFTMDFFGALNGSGSVGPFTFKGYEPSKPFTIPKGFFVDDTGKPVALGDGSGQEFVPFKYKGMGLAEGFANRNASGKRLSIGRRTLASGIAGSRFLDAGLKTITKELPISYTILMNEWFQQAAENVASPVAVVGVNPATAKAMVADIEKQIIAYGL